MGFSRTDIVHCNHTIKQTGLATVTTTVLIAVNQKIHKELTGKCKDIKDAA